MLMIILLLNAKLTVKYFDDLLQAKLAVTVKYFEDLLLAKIYILYYT